MTARNTNLKSLFGFESFRQGQAPVVEQLLAGHSSLAVFPTGSGKSLCYQYTATQLPHLTLVISPLIALMHDQLAFLKAKGIAAASLDSTQSREESQAVMAGVKTGQIKILMISVERFKNENFRRFIQQIAISLLVVDEAHCISEWGHNFRPDYLKLPFYQQELKIPLVLLLTATATRRVQKDMAQKFQIQPQHIVQTGFYRSNLDIELQPIPAEQKANQLDQILRHTQGASIVYVTLQKTAEDVAQFLIQQGHQAQAYHAGLSSDDRAQIQQHFMSGQTRIIVATIAFGMGIDKADIRLVVHYDLPKSIENYSQEIGRAGRDQNHSQCILLANLEGLHTLENFVYGDTPERHNIACLLEAIRQETDQQEWETQVYHLANHTNIRSLALKTLLVQLELKQVITPKYSYYADIKVKWETDPHQFMQQLPSHWQMSFPILLEGIHFKKIWGVPDFDWLQHNANLNRQQVLEMLEFAEQQQALIIDSKSLTEVYQVNLDRLQNTLLLEQLDEYVKQKETSEIERIATMIRFFELDRCLNHNLARYFGDQQAPEHCGHCSVCRQNALRFPPQHPSLASSLTQLDEYIAAFCQAVQKKAPNTLVTATLITRFLTGLSQPMFTKIKARQLPGFGYFEEASYQTVLTQVTEQFQKHKSPSR
ncbi:RecQ family ATP-dependent DNA helicase [Marinomonas posidonica]|uniref:ATP-dependent DNA helicase RecQ n=1 Tax=Marinomonas posidonica (strain CECT 7376 / NCIMB 14433 / IVIA-Po-181) TaxID=491952 RepID=F6CVJ4_MARPP|nr:RecQ family ATP-dependent DNA helicase [Marinomonas posidonica]AEF55371.1 ATP-dependent DNA helicase, RecQ family [Marinomonas posidonica IVIA-Po-181]